METSQLLASIDLDIATRLEQDERFRERYLRTWAANEVATELRTMRKRRVLRQEDLAAQAGTGQSAISRIEKRDYDGWTFKTLLNIAGTLKARLRIKLEPLEDVIQHYRSNETAETVIAADMDPDIGTTADLADIDAGSGTFDKFSEEPSSSSVNDWKM